MSITDELREYAEDWDWVDTGAEKAQDRIEAIADRIDAKHEEAIASMMNDALYHANDKDMADLGWYRALDADGAPIRVGDVMEWVPYDDTYQTVVRKVVAVGADVFFAWSDEKQGYAQYEACAYRHHHAPTVEDVLRDMHAKLDEVTALYVGEAIDSDERGSDEARIFAEYASKLRLRGDAE